jgi:aminobenzoyl-glutamate transport protein
MSYKAKILNKFMDSIERTGKFLPNPISLFALLALIVLFISQLAFFLNWSAVNPVTNETIIPINLLTPVGVEKIFNDMVSNFTSFAPLGVVIIAMLGIGIAESSGLIGTVIRVFVIKTPKRFITFAIVLAGILANMAGDIGYVLLIPLAGIVFISFKRHPIIGMAAAFAGVSGGFSANLFITGLEPLFSGISTEAARFMAPEYTVTPLSNYYFLVASTFLIAFLGTFVTEKIVAPRFKNYENDHQEEEITSLSKNERKGLWNVLIAILLMIAFVLFGLIPENGFLRSSDGTILSSPLVKSAATFVFFFFGITGIVYGFTTRVFKNDSDVAKGLTESMKTLASYIVLCFFAAQFIAYFKWSRLGEILAINGANLLSSMNIGTIPLIICFILLAAVLNLIIGSASAKWAIMAPVFVPMFMQLGYSPELTQMLYRIGDSTTNIITPMMSFFPLIIAFFQKYDKNANIGTVISTMFPYSIVFLIGWVVLAIIWVLLDLPLGPGASLYYGR